MPSLANIINTHRPSLPSYEALYKQFHSDPELSLVEHTTSQRIANKLSSIAPSFTVKAPIGPTGVAAFFKNGNGPTVLLRADIDGLPVREQTGLEYASTKRMADRHGKEQPVMHACGHDMHITALLATAQLLESAKGEWAGTAVLVFQPAEEIAAGAQAMVDDGLYAKHGVPVPDVAFGAHVIPFKAGNTGTNDGVIASAADSWKITIYGKGGHASQPQRSIDPVVMAAAITMRLQTLVSREVAAVDPVVVTVSSIKAGEAENVIPETAEIKVNVRTFDEGVRKRVLDGIRRIVKAELDASGAEREAEYEVISSFPLMDNDKPVTDKLRESMETYFGDKWDGNMKALPGSEDFPFLATSVGKPYCYFIYGGVDPELWDRKAKEGSLAHGIPYNHSSYFAPVIQPTLTTAVDGYAVAALTWLAKT